MEEKRIVFYLNILNEGFEIKKNQTNKPIGQVWL